MCVSTALGDGHRQFVQLLMSALQGQEREYVHSGRRQILGALFDSS